MLSSKQDPFSPHLGNHNLLRTLWLCAIWLLTLTLLSGTIC